MRDKRYHHQLPPFSTTGHRYSPAVLPSSISRNSRLQYPNMGFSRKRLKQVQQSESGSEMGSEEENELLNEVIEGHKGFGGSDDNYSYDEGSESGEGESNREDDEQGDEDEEGMGNVVANDDEMEELEKEYRDLRNVEQNLVHTLKRHKDEDIVKGQAIKSQKALWDKALEIRFLMQKAYSKSNKLPQEPIRLLFLESDEAVSNEYSDLIASSKKAINSLVQLQEALVENNPSITRAFEEEGPQPTLESNGELEKLDADQHKEWLQISQIQSSFSRFWQPNIHHLFYSRDVQFPTFCDGQPNDLLYRVAPFRNKSVDKWQRKADVHSGAAAKKAKLLAFNQNISDQVATYMRDPSKMIKGMQMRIETVGVFGTAMELGGNTSMEANPEGDPELLDD